MFLVKAEVIKQKDSKVIVNAIQYYINKLMVKNLFIIISYV